MDERMNIDELRYTVLDPIFYKKGFVNDEPLCDYEIYMRELVNNSPFFLGLSEGDIYKKPDVESHGEPDAISEKYSLDFKLVESKTYVESRAQYAPSISKISEGVFVYGESKRKGKTYNTILHASLRMLKTYEDIDKIMNLHTSHSKMDKRTEGIDDMCMYDDIKSYFLMLVKNKNLLLFLPYIFLLNDECSDEVYDKSICKALYNDFGLSFRYRLDRFSKMDTFMCCMYKEYFVIYQFENNDLHLIDKVVIKKCPSFMQLKDIGDVWGNG